MHEKDAIWKEPDSVILDMHAHLACLSEEYGAGLLAAEKQEMAAWELDLRAEYGILTYLSCGTPEEWEFLQSAVDRFRRRAGEPNFPVYTSFGIHPWYSDRYAPDDYRHYFAQCDVIGEIGMDSVWCDVPLHVQRRAFAHQLEIAAELKRPVILHTKGRECEIAEMIRDFPEKVCVHWYSGDLETFERFREMDCYFTLGPDLALSMRTAACVCGAAAEIQVGAHGEPREELSAGEHAECREELPAGEHAECREELLAGEHAECREELSAGEHAERREELPAGIRYRHMLAALPAERLFIETDGISAVAWARGVPRLNFSEIPVVLSESMASAAAAKQMTVLSMRRRMLQNLQDFVAVHT